MIFILIITIIATAIIVGFLHKVYGKELPTDIPTNPHKTGLYKDSVTIKVNKKGYNFVYEKKSVEFTAVVKEKARYGDKIEVNYVKLINTPMFIMIES